MALGTFDPSAYGCPTVNIKSKQFLGVVTPTDITMQASSTAEELRNQDVTRPHTVSTFPDRDNVQSKPLLRRDENTQNRHPSRPVQGLMDSKYASRTALPQSEPEKPATGSANGRSTPTVPRENPMNREKVIIKLQDEMSPSSQPDTRVGHSQSRLGRESGLAVSNEAMSSFEINGFAGVCKQADNSVIAQPGNTARRNRLPPTMTRPRSDAASRLATPGAQGVPIKVQVTEATLQEVQAAKLRGISTRGKGRDKNVTTALGHLDLARRPVSGTHSPGSATPISKIPGGRQSAPPTRPTLGSRHVPSRRKSNNVLDAQFPQASNVSPWASQVDLRPVEFDTISDTGGPSVLSERSASSRISNLPFHSGRLLEPRNPERTHPLADWDGSMQPPPTDWNNRPHFGRAASELYEECNRWANEVDQLNAEGSYALFRTVPLATLRDQEKRPDGISMISRITTINKHNAETYGYNRDSVEDILKYAQPLQLGDFGDWGKLDMNRPENVSIKHETTDKLVSNWMRHTEELHARAEADMDRKIREFETLQEYRTLPNPNRPKVNVYLRPATSSDVPRMTEIYNWYIEYSARPVETGIITEADMDERLEDVQFSKLPFIVAVARDHKNAKPFDTDAGAPVLLNAVQRPTSAKENVLGWACAQNFSAGDYVEHISAELEIYVDPEYRQLGIGRCLVDQLMEACDRGYMKRGGYQFHCPREYRHLYNAGGGRDLHKLVIILRKWKYPRNTDTIPATHRTVNMKPNTKRDDQENDYDIWVKKWLESWDFEVEGVLKGAGAKKGRFIDVVHLSRETKWQPAEGRIPDPAPAMH